MPPNHIIQKRHDSKVLKAYELTEKVERGANQLRLSRSKDMEAFQPEEL